MRVRARWLSLILALTGVVARGAPTTNATDPLEQALRAQARDAADRALAYIAAHQRADGSFETRPEGQPAITALCTLAFLSRGHLPDHGEYGQTISKSLQFILTQQHADGMFCMGQPGPVHSGYTLSHTAIYNHAIASLCLSEAYGMSGPALADQIRKAIEKAEGFTLVQQARPKELPKDVGGWRYIFRLNEHQSDLSVTSWQVLFLRSAKNAGFNVPTDRIQSASSYVQRCYDPNLGTFQYLAQTQRPISRGMAGAGMLSLALSSQRDTATARSSATWILAHPFTPYRATLSEYDRYFYSAFYCTQAMFQMGGDDWRRFYPPLVRTLLTNQRINGSWDEETSGDGRFGTSYSTALCVLILDTPEGLLPIFQR